MPNMEYRLASAYSVRYLDVAPMISALRFQPENSTVLIYYAALLVRTGNPSQALTYAQRAVNAAPLSPDA